MIALGGLMVALAEPMAIPMTGRFVNRGSILDRCRRAWDVERGKVGVYHLAARGSALSFRLDGPGGSGKNEIVYQLARELGQRLYVQSGHEELGPEDLALLLVPGGWKPGESALSCHASPLATAILLGGLFYFDDIHRVPERALAVLASVLDGRLELYSAVTGVWIRPVDTAAARSFRFCCSTDSSATKRIPPYIEQRTTPVIAVPMPCEPELGEMVPWDAEITQDDFCSFEAKQAPRTQRELETRSEFRRQELLERLVRIQDRDLKLRFQRAMAETREGLWQEAAEAFETIAAELPEGNDLRRRCDNNRAHSLMELARFDDALSVCRDLLRWAPDFPLALCTLADIFYEIAKHVPAQEERRPLRNQASSLYRRVVELASTEASIREHAAARLAALDSEPTDGEESTND